jgi:hypothetical protein
VVREKATLRAGQPLAHHRRGGRCWAAAPPPPHFPPKRNFKNIDFGDTKISRFYVIFRLNQPLKSANDYYTGILKNISKTYKHVDFFLF